MLGLGLDSNSSLPCSIGVVKRRGINYCFEYTEELLLRKDTVISTGKLQNAKPRLTESRDHG